MVTTGSALLHPLTRTFVSESCSTFLSVQDLTECSSFEQQQEILNASRKYRCIIRECVQKLESTKSGNQDQVNKLCDIFYTTELCWHLCETLYFEQIIGDIILPHLKRWIQFHFVNYENLAVKIIEYQSPEESSPTIETESLVPDYWSTIFGLLCQGNSACACKLIELHSKSNTSSFLKAIKFLKYIPEFDFNGGSSVVEFEHSWKTWKSKVKSELDLGTFSTDKNLEIAMKIICGSIEVDKVLRKHCASWYQYLIAKLSYSQPTIKSSQLGHYVTSSMGVYKESENPELLSLVISSLLKKDLSASIKAFLKMSDNCWCATHLSNLLQVGNLIPTSNQSNERLDKKLIIGYGKYLIKSKVFWHLGVSYLKSCQEEGYNVLNSILPEMDLNNELVAKKLLTFAYQNNMPHIVQYVSTKLCEKNMGLERYVEALAWAVKGKSHDLASNLADIFLKSYVDKGTLELLDVIDNFGADALFVDRLVFLIKFVEFKNKKIKGEYTEGFCILMELLINRMIPDYFRLCHLNEIMELLEPGMAQANKTDFVQILHSIEDYCCEYESVPLNIDDTIMSKSYENFVKNINIFRKKLLKLFCSLK